MSKTRVDLPVTIEVHEKRVFPSFYEEAADLSDPSTGEAAYRIGRCSTHPFVFYLFDEQEDGINGSFVATIDVSSMISALVDRWPAIRDANTTEAKS